MTPLGSISEEIVACRAACEGVSAGETGDWIEVQPGAVALAVPSVPSDSPNSALLREAVEKAAHLIGNYLWNKGPLDEDLIEAHDALCTAWEATTKQPEPGLEPFPWWGEPDKCCEYACYEDPGCACSGCGG